MRKLVPSPSCSVAAALALCSLWSSACADGCPEGFARKGQTCEPAVLRSEASDQMQSSEPDASVQMDARMPEGGSAGKPAADAGAAKPNDAKPNDAKPNDPQDGKPKGKPDDKPNNQAGAAGAQNTAGAQAKPEPVCKTKSYRCAADTLQRCNESGSAWETTEVCDPGRCDVDTQACLVCTPSESRCMGTQVVSCNAQGTELKQTECAAPTAQCQNGACVECNVDVDCAADSCSKRTCTAGKCSAPMPAAFGTECTAPAFDNELPGQCTHTGVCAPVIAIRVAAREAGDGTPINRAYVSANPDGFLKAAGMNGGPPGPWEPFLLIRQEPGGSRVRLWSLANQGYVTPVDPGAVPEGKPLPNAKWLGSRATEPDTFELSSPEIGKLINIRSLSDSHYWSAEDWRELPADYVLRLRAEREQLGPWEQFTLIPFSQ